MTTASLLLSASSPLQAAAASAPGGDTLRWNGRELYPIDEAGVFFREPSTSSETPMPEPRRPAADILRERAQTAPVTCRLIDFVECTAEQTHGFLDDGKSRVLELPGGRFRVTAAPKGFELAWFAYSLTTARRAGTPHLLVWQMPNDRERYTTVTVTTPKTEPWSPPYTGQEKVSFPAYEKAQEPLWYEPDVGLCTYTGRDLPIDNHPFIGHYVFYPKTAHVKVTISSSGFAAPVKPENGGTVSRIWLFEITVPLAERLPEIHEPRRARRRFGLYTTHPWYWLAHYAAPPHTVEQRRDSLTRMCDTLAFTGCNLLEFNAINGSDRASRAWYPDSYYPQNGADLLTELPPVAAARGIDLIPVVTSITAPGKEFGDEPDQHGFSRLSFQVPAHPDRDPRMFNNRAPDPLRPETQRWLIRHLLEIAGRSRGYANVLGVGFRVNGKIGTCYISGEDNRRGHARIIEAAEVGYSTWNLSEFREESGLPVPSESTAAYDWLKADPARWDTWLDFRCRRTRDFWLAARDAIRALRPDWNLYVLTDLPSEVVSTNVHWPGPDAPNARDVTLELLRAHGYDPRLFANDEGIVVQRVMMLDMERFFSKWGAPFGSNPTRYRDFHEQDFLARWYRTAGGLATELYRTYWEEPYHPDGEFGSNAQGVGLRTANATPMERTFYRPATFSMRAANTDTLVLTGWHRGTLGHEHDLRRFTAAFRALPAVEPKLLPTEPAGDRIQAAWYGDRLGIINDSSEPTRVRITLDRALPAGAQFMDAASGQAIRPSGASPAQALTLELDAYDLKALIPQTPSTRRER
ncbi:MAG: hypothetical protein AMXMBFR13_09790 [Phycisphaerae bacterium]